jgi:hypothetical protein
MKRYLIILLLLLVVAITPTYAAAPPDEPPSSAPKTVLADLRGTWEGVAKEAHTSGFRTITEVIKITEKGPNNLYRGWLIVNPGANQQKIMIKAHLSPAGVVRMTKSAFVRVYNLDFQPTSALQTFPTGWQPVLVGSGHWLDDLVGPDDSGTQFFFFKKTSP